MGGDNVYIVGDVAPVINLDESYNGTINESLLTGSATSTGVAFVINSGKTFFGNVIGSATFYGNGNNLGNISNNAIFNDETHNDGGTVGTGIFYDVSHNEGGTVATGIFYDNSTNNSTIGSGVFYGGSINSGAVTNDASFYNGATNSGTVGSGTFYETSYNFGTVSGDATFVGDFSENYYNEEFGGGVVNGVKTRLYDGFNPQKILLRNFTLDGQWTIVADNTFVDLTYAGVDLFAPGSPTQTTLVTQNDGYFLAPLDPNEPVTSCGVLNQNGATYNMASSSVINDYRYRVCFAVLADNITLNGNDSVINAREGSSDYALVATASSTINNRFNAYTDLTVTNLTFGNFAHGLLARGATNMQGISGNGASVTLKNLVLGDVDGSGGQGGVRGGNGGRLNLSTSTTATIFFDGGSGVNIGGDGGVVSVLNSTGSTTLATTSPIYARGGNSTACGGRGGAGGQITLVDSDYDPLVVTNGVNTSSGCGGSSGGSGSVSSRGRYTPPSNGGTTNTGGNTGAPAPSKTSNSPGGSQNALTKLAPIYTVLPNAIKINPLNLKSIFSAGDTNSKKTFSLSETFSGFLFAPISKATKNNFKNFPDVLQFLQTKGLKYEKNILDLIKKPFALKGDENVKGLWKVSIDGIPVKTGDAFVTNTLLPFGGTLSYDVSSGPSQRVYVEPNAEIYLTNSSATEEPKASLSGKKLLFSKTAGGYIAKIKVPFKSGAYRLQTNTLTVPLIVEVAKTEENDVKPKPTAVENLTTKIKNLFGW